MTTSLSGDDNDRYAAVMADPALKPKWRERFEFLHANGFWPCAKYRAAMQGLPVKKKILLACSLLGLFFGFLYFFALGMWRKGLVWLGVVVLARLVLQVIAEGLWAIGLLDDGRGLGIAFIIGVMSIQAKLVIYSYYREQVLGDTGWNPFKDWNPFADWKPSKYR